MKTLHLWLTTAIVFCGTSSAFGQPGSPWGQPPVWYQAGYSSAGYRGQADEGVPLPPDAGKPSSGLLDFPDPPSTLGVPSVQGDSLAPPVPGSFPMDGSYPVNGGYPTDGGIPMDSGIGLPESSTWNAFSPPMTTDPFAPGTSQSYAPSPYGSPGGQPMPSGGGPFGAYSVPPPGTMTYDPFSAPGPAAGAYSSYGANGPQPYRLGWQHSVDTHFIPNAGSTGGSTGNYEEFGVNFNLANTRQIMPGWLLTQTHQFGMRLWDGPIGGAGLPGNAFRFGEDLEWSTPQTGPFSLSLAVTPSLNSDLDASISNEAFQLDGRGIVWWQLDQFWTMGLGAMYWDRVRDRVLPYAGLVYRDDFWEWRLMFPESEIRLFLGNEPMWSKWIYVRGGYNVEAYEFSTGGGGRDEVELEDWQLMGGIQMDAGHYRWFVEAGWLLDREIRYRRNAPVQTGDAFITRLGWRY